MSNTKLLLSRIFASINQTKDIVEEDDVMSKLVQLASLELQDLRQFTQCLQKDCGQSPQALLKIYTQLLSNQETRILLGQRLLRQWLIFKIFQSLDIFKKSERKKRDKVNSVLRSFEFSGKALVDLVVACSSSAEIELSEEDVKEMVDSLREQNAQIDQAFRSLERPFEIQYNPNKSIFEHLNDLISDYKIIPKESLEKELQKELILAYILKNSLGTEIISQSLPELLQQRQSVVGLKKHYEKEFGPTPPQIEEIFKRLKEGEESTLYQNLYFLKFKIFSLNVLQLIRLINKTKESERLIARKEVILFIGNTGSGKSTLILKFLGYNLMHGVYNKLSTLVPKEKLKEQHKSFYTSPEAKSCTRYINAVPVPDEIYPAGTPKIKKNLVVCDSPGFGDSAGVQVDIANGVGMINALHQASSVRLVVILPFDSLTSNRMEGAIKISEIISNLFHQLTVIESIAILFNKVPKQKIREIPQMIQSKITNMTEVQRSNQKLCILLNKILLSSKQEKNYLDPLKQGFNEIFNRIQSMQPINQVKRFQYQFTDATKKDIENFVQSQRNLIKKYCQSGRLSHSYFHFKNLRQLKGILRTNSKLIQCYSQLVKFIQQLSTNWFTLYEDLINQIIKYQSSNSEKLRQVNLKIRQLHKLFKEFEDLRTVSNEQVDKMIEEKKKLIHNRLQKIEEVSQQMITTVKVFSQELDSKFEKAFADKLDESFKQIYFQTQKLLKRKQYSEAAKSLSNLNRLESLIRLTSAPISKERQMIKLKKDLLSTVKNGFDLLTEVEKQQFIKQATVRKANESIQQIQQIIELSFLDDNDQYKKEFNQKLKSIQTKCKKGIRQIENLNVSLQKSQTNAVEKCQLQNKKKSLEFMLQIKFGSYQQNLKSDFDQALSNIKKKIKQNAQILKHGIISLSQKKNDELFKNLQKIKKAIQTIIHYSKIIDNDGSQCQLVKIIQQEYVQFLKRQMQLLKSMDLKLTSISLQKLGKVARYYEKIAIYEKMKTINNERIRQASQQYKAQFYQRIRVPFLEFKHILANCSAPKMHYKNLLSILQKFESFSQYSFYIQDSFDNIKSDSKICQNQKEIIKNLRQYVLLMQQDFSRFIKYQINLAQGPSNLKQLIKTFLHLSSKSHLLNYLSYKLTFQVKTKMQNIEEKLIQIKNFFEKTLENDKSFQKLKQLLQNLKLYIDIEGIYRSKNQSQKYGFRELQENCQNLYKANLKTDEENVISLIKDYSPTSINFAALKTYYDRFICLKQDGKKKRQIMISQLRKIQQKYNKKLNLINNQIEDITFISNRNKIDNAAQIVQQSIKLQRELKILCTDLSDYQQVKIDSSLIQKITTKIYQIYQQQSNSILKLLCSHDLSNFNQKINTLDHLQKIVFNMPQRQSSIQKYIEEQTQKIIVQILKNCYIQQSDKNKSKEEKKLIKLFRILQSGIQKEIYEKYQTKFILDEYFQKYYHNSEGKKQQDIKYRIKIYFDQTFKKFALNLENQTDERVQLENDTIQKLLNFLPSKIKLEYKSSFEKAKQSFFQKQQKQIQSAKNKMLQKSQVKICLQNLFQKSTNAFYKKQIKLSQKWFESLNNFVYQFQQKLKDVQSKINFINYLVELSNQNQGKLNQNLSMNQWVNKKLQYYIKQFKNKGKKIVFELKSMLKKQSLKQGHFNYYQQIETMVIIYNFFQQMNKKKVIQTDMLQDINKTFQEQFSSVITDYFQIYDKKPTFKLYSQEIIDTQRKKEVQSYLKKMKFKIQVLVKINKIVINTKLQFLHNLQAKIHQYESILISYNNQIKKMVIFIEKFHFYGEIKRNMTLHQLEDDLNELNKYFWILQKRQQFFKQYIIMENSDHYDLDHIKQGIKCKFDEYIFYAKKQLDQLFNSCKSESPTRLNLLLTQLKIMKRNQDSFIILSPVIVAEQYSQIIKKINQHFSNVYMKCSQQLEKLKNQYNLFDQNSRLLKESYQFFKRLHSGKKNISQFFIGILNQKILQIFKSKSEEKNQNFKTEMNNIAELQNEKMEQQNIRAEHKYKQQKNKLQTQINNQIIKFSNCLILFRRALVEIIYQYEKQNESFQKFIEVIQKCSSCLLENIKLQLQCHPEDQSSIVRRHILNILNNKNNNIYYKNLHKQQNMDYILQKLEKISPTGKCNFVEDQKDKIRNLFNIYKAQYQKHKNRYISNPTEQKIRYMIDQLKSSGKFIQQSAKFNVQYQRKIQLLAGILALFVILNSQLSQGGIVNFTIEIHPTQITALILLLGVSQDQKISNRLAQVGTGQGKSIILAILSCYLVLIGFKVRCVCYSDYLSKRDEKAFQKLFRKLGVVDRLKYQTFDQLCRSIVTHNKHNLDNQFGKIFLKKPETGWINFFTKMIQKGFQILKNIFEEEKEILLIDEVDFFFQQKFYGNTFQLFISLKDETVKNMINYVWQKIKIKKEAISHKELIESNQFEMLVNKYPALQEYLKNQIHGMISGALFYQYNSNHKNQKAKQESQIYYGYKTVFHKIEQFEKEKIFQSKLDEFLQIRVKIMEFSYSKIPNYFLNILGVTGTLQVLSPYKKQQLKNKYSINNWYAVPSPFGSQCKLKQNYFIVPQNEFYGKIIKNIYQVGQDRPILIFFKGLQQIQQFAAIRQYEPLLNRTNILDKNGLSPAQIDLKIMNSVNRGNITLLTKQFGRGADFLVLDPKLKQCGGLHVIQTFLSLEDSQQIQIKGRTARQGSNGSYDCIISSSELQLIGINLDSLLINSTSTQIHQVILKARHQNYSLQTSNINKRLQNSQKKHDLASQFYKSQKLDQNSFIKYVSKLNYFPLFSNNVFKVVIAFNSAGSMERHITNICQIVDLIFQKAQQILKDRQIYAMTLVQVLSYRNYDSSSQQILQGTPFENYGDNLKKFIYNIKFKGRVCNDAIQVLFQQLNKEQQIDSVILFGNISLNTAQPTQQKRSMRGNSYWEQNGFPRTDLNRELQVFRKKHNKCQLNCFYFDQNNEVIKEINNKTKGINIFTKLKKNVEKDIFQIVSKLVKERFGEEKSIINIQY